MKQIFQYSLMHPRRLADWPDDNRPQLTEDFSPFDEHSPSRSIFIIKHDQASDEMFGICVWH